MPRLTQVRPSRESLSRAYGFTVPESFVTFVDLAWNRAGGDLNRCLDTYFDLICWRFCDEAVLALTDNDPPTSWSRRYTMTPPEVFPIADMGVDGVHFGMLVRVPEWNEHERPIVGVYPMDFSEPVTLLGTSLREALDDELSMALALVEDESKVLADDGRALLEELCRRFDLTPSVEKAVHSYWHPSPIKAHTPEVPDGWRFEPSSDGVGVLAPISAFGAEGLPEFDSRWPIERLLYVAELELRARQPARALWILREANWTTSSSSRHPALIEPLARAYEELNRPLLARMIRAKVNRP